VPLFETSLPATPPRSRPLLESLPLSCALGLVVTLLGCDLFDSDRRPYTPFRPATGDAASQTVGSAPPTPATAPPTLVKPSLNREALIAPPDAKEWRIADRELRAPVGLAFNLGLSGGLGGGHERDVLAWLVGTPDKPVIGELWLYPENGPARLVASAPGFLPTGPSCTHAAHLQQTGPSTIALDIQAACNTPLLPRAPVRSVSVLEPLRDPPKIVGFQLAAPAPGEVLDLEIASRDRDKDGRDDVELSLAVSTGQGPLARASFVWLDRSAGLSRDSSEPLASFARLGAWAGERAENHKSSSEVADAVDAARRLYGSLCSESGVARIALDTGEELPCGELGAVFQALTAANINADLSLGHVERGFADLAQYDWFPSGSKADSERFVKAELKQLLGRVTRRHVIKLVPLEGHPRDLDSGPHYSPLSFYSDGSLLLLTPTGIVRAAPDGRFEYDAGSKVLAWSTTVTGPNGERLTGVAFPCERSEVSWLRSAPNGAPLPPLPSNLIAPRPGACQASSPFTPPRVVPIAWTSEGVSAFVGATLVGPLPAHPPMGSAVSPNGRFAIVPTPWGLLVTGKEKPALWVFDDPTLSAQLRDCVVNDNAQAAACILRGGPQVILPDPKNG
jgi:hypothetical protein